MNNTPLRFKTKEELAKFVIERYFQSHTQPFVAPTDVTQTLRDKGASFVTVYVNGTLHGCIGTAQSFEPLYANIIRNTIQAAFFDSRFEPLSKNNLSSLTVEVSVLTDPSPYIYKTVDELLQFLSTHKPGLIMEKTGRKALFLPAVWDDVSDPKQFLSELCTKAGLEQNSWKNTDVKYFIFSNRTDV